MSGKDEHAWLCKERRFLVSQCHPTHFKKICRGEESSIWERSWLMDAWLVGWISGHVCSGRLKSEPNESLWRSSLMVKPGGDFPWRMLQAQKGGWLGGGPNAQPRSSTSGRCWGTSSIKKSPFEGSRVTPSVALWGNAYIRSSFCFQKT